MHIDLKVLNYVFLFQKILKQPHPNYTYVLTAAIVFVYDVRFL